MMTATLVLAAAAAASAPEGLPPAPDGCHWVHKPQATHKTVHPYLLPASAPQAKPHPRKPAPQYDIICEEGPVHGVEALPEPEFTPIPTLSLLPPEAPGPGAPPTFEQYAAAPPSITVPPENYWWGGGGEGGGTFEGGGGGGLSGGGGGGGGAPCAECCAPRITSPVPELPVWVQLVLAFVMFGFVWHRKGSHEARNVWRSSRT